MVKDGSTRQVTFSKRGTGLFKKANELATLCAAQIVITVFSPGGKPFSFGHLNVESVVSLFLNWYEPRWTASSSEGEGDTDSNAALAVIQDCNGHDAREAKLRRMREILGRLRVQDQEREALNRRLRSKELEDSMYKPSIDELGHNKLVEYKESLEELRSRRVERMHEIKASQSLLLLADGPMNNRTFEPLVDRIKINRNVREMGVVFLKLCDFK